MDPEPVYRRACGIVSTLNRAASHLQRAGVKTRLAGQLARVEIQLSRNAIYSHPHY